MRPISEAGKKRISEIARKHGFSVPATLSMLDALAKGNGTMAQFSDPEFAGPGQWMRGGMTMVSDMFNDRLKGRIDALCSDLSDLLTSESTVPREGAFQTQTQGRGGLDHTQDQASLFVPPTPNTTGHWWSSDLGSPDSTGAQDGVRYAYFARARRLAIELHGKICIYDTLDHHITGFSQQQSVGGTLSFSSQHGLIDVASLPVIRAKNID